MDTSHSARQHAQNMLHRDLFSQWLGIELLEVKEGYCKCSMQVRMGMLNGFGILHGGIAFSLADSALAFAANTHGRLSVALQASITWTKQVQSGETLTAEAKEINLGHKTATYDINIFNEKDEPVAFFRGTVYRTSAKTL